MLLAEIVTVSRRVGATSASSDKLDHLAGLLRRLEPPEIEPSVAFPSGRLRQGRIGLGPAAVGAARPASPADRRLRGGSRGPTPVAGS